MQILLAAAVSILAATAPSQTQPLTTDQRLAQPITITFINSVTVEEAFSTLAQLSGLVFEISKVPEDLRKQPLSPAGTLSVRDLALEQVIQKFAEMKGLAAIIVESKTLVVFPKA